MRSKPTGLQAGSWDRDSVSPPPTPPLLLLCSRMYIPSLKNKTKIKTHCFLNLNWIYPNGFITLKTKQTKPTHPHIFYLCPLQTVTKTEAMTFYPEASIHLLSRFCGLQKNTPHWKELKRISCFQIWGRMYIRWAWNIPESKEAIKENQYHV